ncbi:hypothetical protein [Bdellovibrio sp. KM01]|uniref:hypothetical protein n=1 Tax=Bdellovibrio sp. KM01 TaxID=2748865 RepID=UPI0015E9F7F3|nr:hypothetical protein [Bdellovibrio sp. KM01]QLY24276.1 hypothetical protein HW988_12465 [Bdellovibrio sp. KM01]
MNKLLSILIVIALPLVTQANAESLPAHVELQLKYSQQVAQVDSFLRQEVEALSVKSAYSATHPDILRHQLNIQKGSEYKKSLALSFSNGTIKLCRQVFD